MPPPIALLLCIAFSWFLIARDVKRERTISPGAWLPFIWFGILASRPVSLWLNWGGNSQSAADLEGSAIDRNVFLCLIICGMAVLGRRHVRLSKLVTDNQWLFLLFAYWAISTVWSDHPAIALKRWVKDVGNIVMVMILLTEHDPVAAVRAVVVRAGYILIPLSILFIKYYPELGRYYSTGTYEPVYCGVATEKNALGATAFLTGVFIFWDWLRLRNRPKTGWNRAERWSRLLLGAMMLYLMSKANSSTAFICLMLGCGLLFYFKPGRIRRGISYLGTYVFVALSLFYLLFSSPYLLGLFTGLFGRNPTFTGRTDIWSAVLQAPFNRIIGTGYESFWFGPWVEEWSGVWTFRLNQAHNGYLETYLNGGAIGLGLLLILLVSSGRRLRDELLMGSSLAALRFSLFAVALVYNWTEANFNKLSPVWFVLLIGLIRYQSIKKRKAVSRHQTETWLGAAPSRHNRPVPQPA
jgi:exopolysaccharide production protein ExoQ